MNRSCKKTLWVAALVSLMSVGGTCVLADMLVTADGKTLVGSITKTDAGYTVQTAGARVDVKTGDVKRIVRDRTSSPAAAHGHKTADPGEVASLVQMGKSAMAAGQFTDARDAFKDATFVDPTNATANLGLGYAYLKLEKPQKAVEPLKEAVPKPSKDLSRATTMAMAGALLAPGKWCNPMRAVSFLSEYLKAHKSPLDEPVINALATAISKADSSARLSAIYKDGANLYFDLNKALEQTRPGQRRWGLEWGDAKVVTKKWAEHDAALKKQNDAFNALTAANKRLSAANQALSNCEFGNGSHSPQATAAAQTEVNNAQGNLNGAQKAYDDATAELMEKSPNYGDAIALNDVDFSMSPAPLPVAQAPVQNAPKPPPVIAQNNQPAPPAKPQPPVAAPAPEPASVAQVTRSAVGFAVAPDMVVTAASAVDGSNDIAIQRCDGTFFKAEIVRTQQGITLLKATDAHLPALALAPASAPGALTCVGFPEVDLFQPVAKEMTGRGADQGENWSIELSTSPRLPGGPLLLKNNSVVGVELGDRDSDLGKVPAATLQALVALVDNPAIPNQVAQDPKQAVVMVTAVR